MTCQTKWKVYKWIIHTVEEGIQIVIVKFAEFEKVLAECRTSLYFKVDNDVSQRCLEEHRHAWVLTVSGRDVPWTMLEEAESRPASARFDPTSTLGPGEMAEVPEG